MTALLWDLPFVGLLLSIATLPAAAPRFWERNMGWITLGWAVALVVPKAVLAGPGEAWHVVWHALLIEYLPFVTLLGALYTAAGGILLRGGPAGRPIGNTMTLALGVAMGSFMGTTGAAMVTIQPLLHANAHRTRKLHLAVFAIVLVGNAGGALTPLGDPPLYIGLLRGVPFFWPTVHLLLPFLLVNGLLLGVFWMLDAWLARSEPPPPPPERFRVRGWANAGLIGVVILSVLFQAYVPLARVMVLGLEIGIERLICAAVCIGVMVVSIRITAPAIRRANDFHWHPMAEVAILFAGIFITIDPVLRMLGEGLRGPLAPLLRIALDADGHAIPLVCFWLTGVLSAFLDNAPTYLVFFELARIDPTNLTGHHGPVLAAISAGAVFFGALTYIGNAPNLMLRSIAAHRGVRMPSFFGFMILSAALLLPVFAIMSVLFFGAVPHGD